MNQFRKEAIGERAILFKSEVYKNNVGDPESFVTGSRLPRKKAWLLGAVYWLSLPLKGPYPGSGSSTLYQIWSTNSNCAVHSNFQFKNDERRIQTLFNFVIYSILFIFDSCQR